MTHIFAAPILFARGAPAYASCMRTRQWILAGLLALPVLGWAQDTTPPVPRPQFDLAGNDVRKVISDTAASQYGGFLAETRNDASTKPEPSPAVAWRPPGHASATPRTFDHYDCDVNECVARDQEHDALYTVPTEYPESLDYVRLHEDGNLGCLPSFDALSPEQRRAYCKAPAVTADEDDRSFGEELLDSAAVGLLEALFGGK